MKNKLIYLFIFLSFLSLNVFPIQGKVLYDQKALTVGVLSNESYPQFSDNHNIRFLGKFPSEELLINGGQITLDKLFNLNSPSIENLYRQAFKESTKEEFEIAIKDISADPKTILESEGAIQLIKNNYIVLFENIDYKKKKWTVYHVEIDDEIINQVFYNWNNPSMLKQINIPLKLIASGKIKTKQMGDIIFKISKKVGAFAIRGPVLSENPVTAYITKIQGVEPGYLVKVFQTNENPKGELYSKTVSHCFVVQTNDKNSQIKVVGGRKPSYKKGDIAIVTGMIKHAFNLEGEYSFGNDWRAGGKFLYEIGGYVKNISLNGILGIGINQFNKEPLKVWHQENSLSSNSIQPSLRTYSIIAGVDIGYSFLTKFEIIPYFTFGLGVSSLTKQGYMWNAETQTLEKSRIFKGIPLEGGIKLAYNLYYPLQLLIGANFNYYAVLHQSIDDDLHRNQTWENIVANRHKFNRLNFTVGFRYNF